LGDGVFELLVRERLLQGGTLPAHVLHHKAVKKVNATAQAAHFDALSAVLSEEEQKILRRGRNAVTAKVPKSCTPEEYRKATAIEALFGYLYLKGEIGRISELYEIMDCES
jgi:ribonuclease-3 family protein